MEHDSVVNKFQPHACKTRSNAQKSGSQTLEIMGFEGSRGHLGPLSPQIGRIWQVAMLYIDNPCYYIYIENNYGSRFFKYRRFFSVVGGKRLGKHPLPRGGTHHTHTP